MITDQTINETRESQTFLSLSLYLLVFFESVIIAFRECWTSHNKVQEKKSDIRVNSR